MQQVYSAIVALALSALSVPNIASAQAGETASWYTKAAALRHMGAMQALAVLDRDASEPG